MIFSFFCRKSAATGDRAPSLVLSHDSPALAHGPSDGHARSGPVLLPNNLQSILRAHNEDPTNARPYRVPGSNNLYATSNGVPPDTNSRRPKRVLVRGLLEQHKRPAAVEAGRS